MKQFGVDRMAAVVIAAMALLVPRPAAAQRTPQELQLLRLEATPIGALPPMPLPMPASRNHNYWGFRLQAGHRRARNGPDLSAVAGGVDWQLRGGSVFGATAGLQERVCEDAQDSCGRHALFGLRARFGLLTGGPGIGELFGDYSATVVFGTELGVGYAPNIVPAMNACTIDLGMPLSYSMLQRVRLVTFFTPTLAWNIDCSPGAATNDVSFLAGLGIAMQQLGLRGLDVAVGLQKIFESRTGYHVGLSISYVRLP